MDAQFYAKCNLAEAKRRLENAEYGLLQRPNDPRYREEVKCYRGDVTYYTQRLRELAKQATK